MSIDRNQLIVPDWPAPKHIQAFTTTRHGGVSGAPYDSLNLGFHVGDDSAHVASNVKRVEETLGENIKVNWMVQVHGIDVFNAQDVESEITKGDAMYTQLENQACSVLTADCLPVLFCDKQGVEVAAAHAGWRGLAAGILSKTIDNFVAMPREILVWLGPAIGKRAFEVGDDVKCAFMDSLSGCYSIKEIEQAFVKQVNGKYLANLHLLARLELKSKGIEEVYGSHLCTVNDSNFYSYRRDIATGRMATVIVKNAKS